MRQAGVSPGGLDFQPLRGGASSRPRVYMPISLYGGSSNPQRRRSQTVEYRFVRGDERRAGNALVMPFAVQLRDGSLDLDGTVAEPPGMFIDELRSDGQATERLNITVHAARDLAQALLEAADEIDRWATT